MHGRSERKVSSSPKASRRPKKAGDNVPVEWRQERVRILRKQPLSGRGLSPGAAEVYDLDEDQVESINQAILDTRRETADLVNRNLERIDTGDPGEVVYQYLADPQRAEEITEHLRAQLESIAGKGFAEAGIKVVRSSQLMLRAGGDDIKFVFNPIFKEEENLVTIEGTYQVDFSLPSGDPAGFQSGALKGMDGTVLGLDFSDALRDAATRAD